MGFIGSLLSNSQGAGFQAAGTNIQQPVDAAQAQAGLAQQQQYAQGLGGAGAQGLASQNMLTGQLQQQAQGLGPNPALAQLQQTTGQNIQGQAALMAGQRGVSQNAGLLARQAGQQGAGIQQGAIGQAATLGAQQQLSAQGQLGALSQGQISNQGNALQQYNSNLGNYIQGQNNANVGMQSNQNNANATLASGNQKAQTGLFQGLLGAGGVTSVFSASPGAAAPGGGAASGAAAGAAFAHGGTIPHVDAQGGPKSFVGRYLKGGSVAGKAKVPGRDVPQNDTVKTMLTPGEGVIDLETLNDKGPIGKMARQVMAHINAKKGSK